MASGRGIEQFQCPADRDCNDYNVLEEEHQFLWEGQADTWGKRLAKAYYDKLFKEYTISDLSRYKENMLEDGEGGDSRVSGKGQFVRL